MLATAVGGVLTHGKAVEAEKELLAEKENDRKRQLSGSDIDEDDSVKRAKGCVVDVEKTLEESDKREMIVEKAGEKTAVETVLEAVIETTVELEVETEEETRLEKTLDKHHMVSHSLSGHK